MVPTCFISYSWDTPEHKNWVRELAEELQRNGVRVSLDQWDLHPGADLMRYMESCIRQSDYVLLICSPKFAEKANARIGGAGYEQAVVTGEVFQGAASPKKFVPVLRNGTGEDSLPSYLKSRIFVDFRTDGNFEGSLEILLRHMHDSPRFKRPELGPRPDFISAESERRRPLVSVPGPVEGERDFEGWLREEISEKKFIDSGFAEENLLRVGYCTLVNAAPDPRGYGRVQMKEREVSITDDGVEYNGIYLEDIDDWRKERRRLVEDEGAEGTGTRLLRFVDSISEDSVRVEYTAIDYVDSKALHNMMLKNGRTFQEKYRAKALESRLLGTTIPNLLATAVVLVASDRNNLPRLILGNRRPRGTSGYDGTCWSVSIGEQYKPVKFWHKGVEWPADTSIIRNAQRGLREELFGVDYDIDDSVITVQGFVLEDYLNNYIFLAVADMRDLTFEELVKLWRKKTTIDREEHLALAALPLKTDVLRRCINSDRLPIDEWKKIRDEGMFSIYLGVDDIKNDKWHIWQPNSHIRLACALWYLEEVIAKSGK